MPWGKRKRESKPAYRSFNNIEVNVHGISFASKLEASVYMILKAREQAGEIKVLQIQDHVYLTRAEIHYIPDFKCVDLRSGETFFVEAKGYANERWPMKKRLWKFYGPGPLEIWMGTHQRPILKETLIPKIPARQHCPNCLCDKDNLSLGDAIND